MPRQRAPRNRKEILSRWIRIESVRFGIYRDAEKPRRDPPRFNSNLHLELRGDADQPLGEVRRFVVHVHIDERKDPGSSIPAATGAFIRLKPEADAVVSLDSANFDRLWTLAAANLLRHCWLAFTRPYRGSSLIVSASFSNEPEE
jgi:hypothetical protein